MSGASGAEIDKPASEREEPIEESARSEQQVAAALAPADGRRRRHVFVPQLSPDCPHPQGGRMETTAWEGRPPLLWLMLELVVFASPARSHQIL